MLFQTPSKTLSVLPVKHQRPYFLPPSGWVRFSFWSGSISAFLGQQLTSFMDIIVCDVTVPLVITYPLELMPLSPVILRGWKALFGDLIATGYSVSVV